MHPINEAVAALKPMLDDCGIGDSPVVLTPGFDLPRCAYERGVPIQVLFGGRTAVFVSDETMKATTKASFMIGAPLKKATQRAAAAGIVNAVTGFLCTVRALHACRKVDHAPCRDELVSIIRERKVFCCGEMPDVRRIAGSYLVNDPKEADIILITGDGMVNDDINLEKLPEEKIIYLGPSTVGTASLLHCRHFCPFGRGNLQTSEE